MDGVLVAVGYLLARLGVDVRRAYPNEDVHNEEQVYYRVKGRYLRLLEQVRLEGYLYGYRHRLVDRHYNN